MRLMQQNASYNTPRGRMLGGWRDVLDDIRALCLDLRALPDRCGCGSAAGIGEACICRRGAAAGRSADCRDCAAAIERMRPDIDALGVDTLRFFPLVSVLAATARPEPALTESAAVEQRIAGVIRTFEHLALAVGEFRGSCRTVSMPALKTAADALLEEALHLDAHLRSER